MRRARLHLRRRSPQARGACRILIETSVGIELGLVDELRRFRYPVVGGGTPFLPPATEAVPLELIETRTFSSRVIYERYGRAGPVAAYSFDAPTGTTTLEDTTAAAHPTEPHTGTLSAEGTEWTNGKYGGALHFDGAKGCVTIPSSEALQLKEEFTLESWVKPEGELTHLPILYKSGEGFPAYDLGIGLTTSGLGEGQIGTLAKSHTDAATTSSMEAGVWQHLAVTYDGAHLRLYLEGNLVATKPVTEPNSGVAGALTIGCGGGYHFRGRIDELRIYNRTLTAGEVKAGMALLPRAETIEAYGVEPNEAVLAGVVNSRGHETTYDFEYGTSTRYGMTAPEPGEEVVSGTTDEEVEEAISNLAPETIYHYRVNANSSAGTFLGADKTFKTGKATVSNAEYEQEEAELLLSQNKPFVNMMWNGNLSATTKSGPESLLALVKDSGSSIFRVPINGGGQLKDDERVFEQAGQEELTILPVVQGVGESTLIPQPNTKGIRPAWRQKLEELFAHFGAGGQFWQEHPALKSFTPKFWEIWNEPNVEKNGTELTEAEKKQREKEGRSTFSKVSPAEYASILQESHDLIHSLDSEAELLFGGLLSVGAYGGGEKEEEHIKVGQFIREVGHTTAYAALSLHPYAFKTPKGGTPVNTPDVEAVVSKVRRNIQIARGSLKRIGAGSKQIWITELGWPVRAAEAREDKHHRLVSESIQRELLNRSFSLIKRKSGKRQLNIRNVFYYNIMDRAYKAPPPLKEPNETQQKQEREDHERANYLKDWAFRCGLIEAGEGGEEGKPRESWYAFQGQANVPPKFP